jgi:hypothetical protein
MGRSYLIAASALLLYGLGCTGLLENKVTQCNDLIDAINPVAEQMGGFSKLDTEDFASTKQALDEMSTLLASSAERIDAVELTDETIQDYARQYAQMCRDLAGHASEMSAIVGKMEGVANEEASFESLEKLAQLGQEMETVAASVDAVVQREAPIVQGLNAYCHE